MEAAAAAAVGAVDGRSDVAAFFPHARRRPGQPVPTPDLAGPVASRRRDRVPGTKSSCHLEDNLGRSALNSSGEFAGLLFLLRGQFRTRAIGTPPRISIGHSKINRSELNFHQLRSCLPVSVARTREDGPRDSIRVGSCGSPQPHAWFSMANSGLSLRMTATTVPRGFPRHAARATQTHLHGITSCVSSGSSSLFIARAAAFARGSFAERRPHLRRRSGLRRPRLLRRQGHPHAEPRPAGQGGHAVHELLRGPAGLHRVAGVAHDGLLLQPRRHGRALNHTSTIGIHPDEKLLPELLQGEGLRHRVLRQVAPRHRPPFLPDPQRLRRVARACPYSNDNGPLHPTIRGIPAAAALRRRRRSIANATPTSRSSRGGSPSRRSRSSRRTSDGRSSCTCRTSCRTCRSSPRRRSGASRGAGSTATWSRNSTGRRRRNPGAPLEAATTSTNEHARHLLLRQRPVPVLRHHAGSAGPLREGKLTTFEGGVRVPCIARWPGKVPAGRVCDESVHRDRPAADAREAHRGGAARGHGSTATTLRRCSSARRERQGARVVLLTTPATSCTRCGSGDWKLHLPHEYLDGERPARARTASRPTSRT